MYVAAIERCIPYGRKRHEFLIDDVGRNVQIFYVPPCGILFAHSHAKVERLQRDGPVLFDQLGDVGHVVHEVEVFPVVAESHEIRQKVIVLGQSLHVQQFGIVATWYAVLSVAHLANVQHLIHGIIHHLLEIAMATDKDLCLLVLWHVPQIAMLMKPSLLLQLIVQPPRSAMVMHVVFIQFGITTAHQFGLRLADVIKQACAGVPPIPWVILAWLQVPTAHGVEIARAVLGEQRQIHITEPRQKAILLAPTAMESLHLTACGKVLIPQKIKVSCNQHIAFKQNEATRQQFPELLHTHDMLGRSVVAQFRHVPFLIWIFGQLLFEIDDLALGVIQHLHALHLFCEGAGV